MLIPINHQVVGFLEGSNGGKSPEQEGAASSSGVSAVPQEERSPNRCLITFPCQAITCPIELSYNMQYILGITRYNHGKHLHKP